MPNEVPLNELLGPLPEPDLQADPCSADGTQTEYYTAGTVRRLLAAERERLAREVAGLHMAQSVNNQNHPSAWHDAVDAALAVIRGA